MRRQASLVVKHASKLAFDPLALSLHLKKNSRACGEIGRRARLRIWCFATCRFESYHAHDWTKEEFSKKREFLFFLRIDNASSKRSREAPRQCCRVGCEKRVLSIFISLPFLFKKSTTRAAKGYAKHRASGAAWVAKNKCCQFLTSTHERILVFHKRH